MFTIGPVDRGTSAVKVESIAEFNEPFGPQANSKIFIPGIWSVVFTRRKFPVFWSSCRASILIERYLDSRIFWSAFYLRWWTILVHKLANFSYSLCKSNKIMHHWWRPLLEKLYLQAGTSPRTSRPCYTLSHKLHIEVSMEAKCNLLCQYGLWWTASTKEQLMTMHIPPDNLNQNVPTCEMQSGASICNVLNCGRWPIWQVKLGLFLWEHSNSRLSSISDEIEVLVSLMLTIRAVSAGRQWEILPAHRTALYQVLLITRRLVRDTAKRPSQRVEGKVGEEIAWCKRYLKLEQHDKCLHHWILLSSYVIMLQFS